MRGGGSGSVPLFRWALCGALLGAASPCAGGFAGDYPTWTAKTGQIGVSPQLWAVTELQNGLLAVGTPDGLLLYDGQDWLAVTFANEHAARSLTVSAEGELYVGGVGDLAVLRLADGEGPRLVSLLPELPDPERGLATVTEAITAGAAVCFRAGVRVLCREGGRFREYAAPGDFQAIAAAEGRLFALAEGAGLVRLTPAGDVLPLAWRAGGEDRGSLPTLRALTALDGRHLIAKGEGERLLRLTLDPDGLAVERVEPWGERMEGRMNRLRTLAGGRVLLTTYDRGAYLIDGEGRVEVQVGLGSGLASPLVTDGTIDAQGRLWLTQDGGISRIDLRSAFREWPTSGPLGGRPLVVLALPEAILVGTTQGLMRLDAAGWRRVEPLAMQTLALAAVGAGPDREVLAANAGGLYRIEDRGVLQPLLGRGRAASILASRRHPERLFLGHSLGVLEAERGVSGWRLRQALSGPVGHVRDLAELQDGSLIAVETAVAVWRFRRGPDGTFLPGERLEERHGVTDPSTTVLITDGRGWKLSASGVVLDLTAEGPLLRDARWSGALRDPEERIVEVAPVSASRWFLLLDRPGRVWAEEWIAEDTGAIRRLRELPGSDRRELSRIFFDPYRHLIWCAGAAGLYSFDPDRETPRELPPRLLLREVRRGDGALLAAWRSAGGGEDAPTLLSAAQADLTFRFAAPGAVPGDRIAFSYRLSGLQEAWSEFLEHPSRSYNNLPAGRYRFELRARDREGRVSPVLSYAFAVAPPWFLSPWAYLAYLLAALGLLHLAARLGARAARQRAERLERIVAERTAALAEANARLERAAFTDPLTGLWNRRLLSLEERRAGWLHRDGILWRPRHGWLLALVDLDHFKAINDRFGHAAGDEVLCEAARRLRAAAREDDWVLRWGGEEFLCMVALDQPLAEAELARRWLEAIGAASFRTSAGAIAVTASVGLAHFPLDPADPQRFDLEASIQTADEALYRAKAGGRDRAVVLRWCDTAAADERGRRLEAREVPRR